MITSADVELRLNPEGSSTKFQSDQIAAAIALAISQSRATVQAHMPEEYRRFQTSVYGLVLTRDAVEDETVYTLPSWLVFESGFLWRNLEGRCRDRRKIDAEDFTHDPILNTITTSEAAEDHDTIVMEIVHSSEYPEILKKFCLDLTIAQIIRDLPRLVGPESRETYAMDVQNTYEQLKMLRKGGIRINEWDELDLLSELETVTPQGPGTLTADGW